MTRLSALAVAVALAACVPTAADLQYWLDDVPDYNWYHGCAPTAGGMAIGYWDLQPGYGNLRSGTAPLYANDANAPLDDIYQAIASQEHIAAPYNRDLCIHDGGANSLACFMHAEPDGAGSASSWNIASGMRAFAAWDDPQTAISESYAFSSVVYYAPRTNWPAWRNDVSMGFDTLRYEIMHGRPVLLGLSLNGGFGGHCVLAYGYRIDNHGREWYAVRDTWQDGDSNGLYGIVSEVKDGQEWWRWDENAGEAFGEGYYVDLGIPFVPTDGPITEAAVGDFADDLAEALTLDGVGEVIYASLATSDRDWYRVWLEEGERFVAQTQDDEGYSTAIDTMIALYDPDGQYLRSSNDAFGIPGASLLWWEADSAGWWSFSVQSGGTNGTGDYVLSTYEHGFNPEPGTILLVTTGLVGLVLRRRQAVRSRA